MTGGVLVLVGWFVGVRGGLFVFLNYSQFILSLKSVFQQLILWTQRAEFLILLSKLENIDQAIQMFKIAYYLDFIKYHISFTALIHESSK